jgi:glycosyltransferase involved in cell wall biosynthesis
MRLGIDASNIRAGGGITHLYEILRILEPNEFGIDRITIWSGRSTLASLENKPWLEKVSLPVLDKSLPFRTFWQLFLLDRSLREAKIDFLFIPGGIYFGNFEPFATMSQNLLPFDDAERKRFGLSLLGIKLYIIKLLQKATFQHADGIIFLTETAKEIVQQQVGSLFSSAKVINHGVSGDFQLEPREQKPLSTYNFSSPFRWLYVSTVSPYKHQDQVIKAAALLREKGYPVSLELIGDSHGSALSQLNKTINQIDPGNDFVTYHGPIAYTELKNFYHNVDGFIFASSCETFGQILLEAMSSGLPIACSERSVMPEILGKSAEYFNPENPESIAEALINLIEDIEIRRDYSWAAYKRSLEFSWDRCTQQTFSFIKDVFEKY